MTETLQPAVILGPGQRILEELDARGWTQKDLADVLGRPVQAINEIVKGTKQITPETAIQLGEAFGTSPNIWLALETNYRLRLAIQREPARDDVARRRRLFELVPVPELLRRQWIPHGTTVDELERAVCRFLRIEQPEDEPKAPVANLRNTATKTPEHRARLAWTMRAVALAEQSQAPRTYDAAVLRGALPKLFTLAADTSDVARIPALLAEVGVRLVIVPHLPQTYLDGAAFWLDDGPVVALTLRYDRLDYLWFTLAHELGHVLDDRRDGVLDDPSHAAMKPPAERRADESARQWLIDADAYRQFLAGVASQPTRAEIVAFARTISRHPSIVLGRLQHDRVLTYAQLRDLHAPVSDYLAAFRDQPIGA